jgi:hypothetical protein
MAATEEFYIREASETEARGPFILEQLVSLAETGQVSFETLWYDPSVEDWAAIGANDKLRSALFPEKRKLRMKSRESLPQTASGDSLPPITVQDMLAGAEGRTKETRDKVDPTIAMANAARIGMWSAVACLVLSAAGEALPAADAISALDLGKILDQPLVFLGAADLFIATMLGLGVVSFYPVVRFRAAAGLGLFGFVFLAQGQATPLLAVAAGCAGLYFATVFVEMLPVMIAAALGVVGMGGAAYFLLSV